MTERKPVLMIGLALSAIWVVLLLGFWLLIPVRTDAETGGITRLVIIIGIVMPLILIWMAVGLAHAISDLRAEAAELRSDLDQLKQLASKPPKSAPPQSVPEPMPTQPLPAAQPRPAPAVAIAQPRQSAAAPHQASMDFDSPEPAPVPADTLVLALNFPDDADDHETISALRTALKEPETARVLRAAQDVVTLLAGHGIFMDDLPPEHVPPAIWRKFAEGERGKIAAKIGGIRDAGALEIVSALLRGDEIFRDTAHHFLRHFDTLLTRDLPRLEDVHVQALTDTRTARGFMLIGRAAGVFGQTEA
ncbi:hypothetical protein [Paracoccus onubensis]|uniref:Uncharacterized protein n=1 Tax=Paracoccus onubensis TaxID=1675788 RepID=A0A418SPN1_9RHOB|nr:hypothetical protein [Paracoccus onubensis]RJE82899.1 hypothetical protein D3P04_17810 [Paracoccus onubensis]